MLPVIRKSAFWVAIIVASAVLGGAALVGIQSLGDDGGGTTTVIERVTDSKSSNISSAIQDVSDLYEQVRPSVVRVQGSRANSAVAVGSGVVLDKQGNILTNYHVIRGFDQLDVTFADGTAVQAKIVGTDPGNDLAVIRVSVNGDELKPATLADSEKVRPGEMVIAVGNPFSLDGSVTQGIVSGVGRRLSEGAGGRPLRQLIQSDAAINPGNSGGALFNARGEVIGITTAIENPSGERVFVGIGYAVPINTARRFLPDMLAGKTVDHPRLGVGLDDVTPAKAASLGLSIDKGAMIVTVDPNSAAAKAGLRAAAGRAAGDVIVQIDGQQVKSYDDLANYLDTKKVGDKVQVKFVRENRESTVEVTLDAWTAGAQG